jgi:branched-chain amino acid transport system permease protein
MIFALGYNLLLGYGGCHPSAMEPTWASGLCVRVAHSRWAWASGARWARDPRRCARRGDRGFVHFPSRGIYYALLTIAFGQVFWFLAVKWHTLTGGEDGLLNIRRPAMLGHQRGAHLLCARRAGGRALLLWRLVHSPFGRVLGAVKQNEARAAFAGHNTWLYKWWAFVISSAIAGLAGALFALAQQSAYPNVMGLHNSGFVVMMVLVGGGLVSFWGRCWAWRSSSSRATCSGRTPRPGSSGTGSSSWRWCSSSPRASWACGATCGCAGWRVP